MSRKLALVIGNSEYTDSGLAQLNAPGRDADEFARILNSEEYCRFDEVKVLLNESDPIIREHIDELFNQKKPDDLLLLYFSGHGIRDEFGALYLAVKNTNRNRLRSTAIKSDFIREAMDQSRSMRQVLILDCCNSGAFVRGTKSAIGTSIGTASAFEGKGYGRIILTASDSTQFAWEGDQLIGETDNSLFTHFLIQGLEGEADRNADGDITVDELYDYVYGKIVNITPKQTPGKWSYKEQGEIILRHYTPLGNKATRTEELRRELFEREKQYHVKTQELRRESEKLLISITQPAPPSTNVINTKKRTLWVILFSFTCLTLLCASTIGFQFFSSYIVVSTMRPENPEPSQTNPILTFALEPDTPSATNTTPIPFSNKPEEFLDDIKYISADAFNEPSNSKWNNTSGIIEDGVLKVFGTANWGGATYDEILGENQGIIVDFKYTAEHYFEMFLDYGSHGEDSNKRFGFYIISNLVATNNIDGQNDIGGENISGDFKLQPNKDYSLLLAVLPEGEFLLVIWNPKEPSEPIFYKERFGEDWAGLGWVFRLQAEQGAISLDNFYQIAFNGLK